MDTTIQKGVPLPEQRVSGLSAVLRKLQVGESFLYPAANRTNVSPTARRVGIKVTTASVDETLNGEKAVRIWRIE